jgi:GxxExxY protein
VKSRCTRIGRIRRKRTKGSSSVSEVWMRGELLEAERVHSIVGAFFAVYNYYGCGFSEGVYSGALAFELADRGHRVDREVSIAIGYKGRHVAWQRMDMLIDERVIVESKATEKLSPTAGSQLTSYLRATTFEVGVLLHFGPSPKFYRFIDFPKRKLHHTQCDSSNSSNSSNSCPT